MELNLSIIDKFLIYGYFILILIIGLLSPAKKNQDDYIVIGRKLSIVPFSISLVATWYGGILGIGEFTFKYGISNWFVFGFPYYIFAILFAKDIASGSSLESCLSNNCFSPSIV